MANVYIGTNLQLKDKNFSRNLKKIANETKAQTDKIKNSFMSVSTAIKGMVAAAGVGKLFSDISSSMKQAERSVGSLRAITSSADEAKKKFQELNDLSRSLPQSFDEITAAAIALGKNGLSTSAENIKALAKISRGTNTSLETLAQALSSASMGQLKGLRQIGIIAKQEGDEISLTYQGTTEKIKANTKDLQAYIERLANTKFADTLKPEMEGITGAAKGLGDAWGDFTRELGESGIGDIIKDVMITATKALDEFTVSIKTGFLGEVVQNIKSTWTGVRDTLKSLFADLGDAAEKVSFVMEGAFENAGDGILAKLSHVLKLAALGFRQLYGYISGAFGALDALGEHIGATLQEWMSGGTERVLRDSALKRAYKTMVNNRMASMTEAEKNAILDRMRISEKELLAMGENAKTAKDIRQYAEMLGVTQKSLDDAKKKVDENRVRIEGSGPDVLDKMAQAFNDATEKTEETYKTVAESDVKARAAREAALEALRKKTENLENEPEGKPIGIPSGAGGKGGAGAAQKDTWSDYYQKFLDGQAKALSAAEKIEYEYRKNLAELEQKFRENSGVSQEQYNNVKLGIEKNYQDARKALEQEAFDFLQNLRGDETYRMQEEYTAKLTQLEEYHAQKLISEQEYLEQEKAIRDAYYEQDAEYQKRKRQEKFDKQHEPYLQQASALGQLAQAFSGLTSSMDESSGAYRALFAVQKGFAVASATMNAVVAWMNAFANGGPWPANLAAYGQAIAMTTSILAELSSIKAYDKGGSIPAGSVGLVGEIGPELISGPATVTSRRDTAKMLGGDITINLMEDASRAGQVSKEKTDEGEIINIVVANIRSGGGVSDAIGTAYGLSRRGQ